ncbi:hypothetical protein, partial [Novacetimonas hansenii]|uniref:hypothetical protein n=1 Tax=Novacetimonas hansenii TaxID=436 RepID=UPI001A7E8D62
GWYCSKTFGSGSKRVSGNKLFIKNKKSFGVPPFDRKRRRLLKLFGKIFTKNFYNFRMLLKVLFQAASKTLKTI